VDWGLKAGKGGGGLLLNHLEKICSSCKEDGGPMSLVTLRVSNLQRGFSSVVIKFGGPYRKEGLGPERGMGIEKDKNLRSKTQELMRK